MPFLKGFRSTIKKSHHEPPFGWVAKTANVIFNDINNRSTVAETREVTLVRPPLVWLSRAEKKATVKS